MFLDLTRRVKAGRPEGNGRKPRSCQTSLTELNAALTSRSARGQSRLLKSRNREREEGEEEEGWRQPGKKK